MVLRDNSLDQSPALCEGVPALPPFPIKWTVAPASRVFSTIIQNFSICVMGKFSMVATRDEAYDSANSVKSKSISPVVREGASYLRVDESK